MHHILLLVLQLLVVHEGNGVASDADFFHELSEVAVRTFSQICEETVFELVVRILELLVRSQLISHLPTHNVLVSEDVSDTLFVYGHAGFVGKVHCSSLHSVSVLFKIVFLLRDLCKLNEIRIIHRTIHHLLKNLFSDRYISVLVVEQVNKGALVFRAQVCQVRHQLLEFFLLILKFLKFSQSLQVEHFNHQLKLFAFGVAIFQKSWVEIFFVVKLSDLMLRVELDGAVIGPVTSCNLFKDLELDLSLTRSGIFTSLG